MSTVRSVGESSSSSLGILIDRGKRGDARLVQQPEVQLLSEESRFLGILVLDQVLESLTQSDPRHGRIVEPHSFEGLSFEETSEALGLSLRAVSGDWAMARAWLRTELTSRS